MAQVGQVWRRRVEQHEQWDRVRVVGVFEQEHTDEFSLQPVNPQEGFTTISVTAADLEADFTLETVA